MTKGKVERLIITSLGKEFVGLEGFRQRTFQGEAWFKVDDEELMVPIRGVLEQRDGSTTLKSLDFGLFYPKLADFLRREITLAIGNILKTGEHSQ